MCWFGILNLAIHSQITECHSENSTLAQTGWQHHSYTKLAAICPLGGSIILIFFTWYTGTETGCFIKGCGWMASWWVAEELARRGAGGRGAGGGAVGEVLVWFWYLGKIWKRLIDKKRKQQWVCEGRNYLYPLILSDLKNYLDGLGSSVIQILKLLETSLSQSVSPPFCLY